MARRTLGRALRLVVLLGPLPDGRDGRATLQGLGLRSRGGAGPPRLPRAPGRALPADEQGAPRELLQLAHLATTSSSCTSSPPPPCGSSSSCTFSWSSLGRSSVKSPSGCSCQAEVAAEADSRHWRQGRP